MKTKIQMRRAIACDVIAQLDDKLLKAQQGIYLNQLTGPFPGHYGENAQPLLLQKKRKPCTVCALGAGIVSLIRMENEHRVGDFIAIYGRLHKYFTYAQLSAIEKLFECWAGAVGDSGWKKWNAHSETARLRFLWAYAAKHPKFTQREIFAAAKRAK